jgi:hypothetical protein
VKTLTDPAARMVNFTPKSTTVSALRRLRPPATLGARNPGVERRTYRVRARLVEFKIEEDSDVHLVIAEPGFPARRMIVEFPATGCTRAAAAKRRSQMARARSALMHACGVPNTSEFLDLRGTATTTGVAFFDFKHGQPGVAPNAIELHPVLGFSRAAGGVA